MTTGKAFFNQFLGDYYAESEEHLGSAKSRMLAIEASGIEKPVEANVLDELLRNFHSLKGLSAMVGLEEATVLSHHIEDYLKELKRPHSVISREGVERVIAGITAMEQVVEAMRQSTPLPDTSAVLLQLDAAAEEARANPSRAVRSDSGKWRFLFRPSPGLAGKGVTVGTIRARLKNLGEVIQAAPQVLADNQIAFEFVVSVKAAVSDFEDLRSQGVEFWRIGEEAAPDSPAGGGDGVLAAGSDNPRTGSADVIRVEMTRLDDLIRIAGELVITRFKLDERLRTGKRSEKDWEALQEINASMERQLRELRAGVVRIRMVPIGQVFERMRFVVRGLERELGRSVDVHMDGHDTEIDKVVVERMMDPLLHLVRNAVSHGLEPPAERRAAGKPEMGLLRLSARTTGDTVLVEVEDDGRGMDLPKIASRARTLGWLDEDEVPDTRRVLDIIASPGFTTRDEADLASGRGIGMGVVKEAVSNLGGSLSLSTAAGQGTRFAIRLPLTLMIADSLLVTVGGQRFAVPQTSVREVLSVDFCALKTIEKNEVIPFRGGVLPILHLARLFGFRTAPAGGRFHVLVIAEEGDAIGLGVDRITGQREIVVRTITDPLLRVPGVVGATELGDGKPVLILDPHSVVAAARHREGMGTAL